MQLFYSKLIYHYNLNFVYIAIRLFDHQAIANFVSIKISALYNLVVWLVCALV